MEARATGLHQEDGVVGNDVLRASAVVAPIAADTLVFRHGG